MEDKLNNVFNDFFAQKIDLNHIINNFVETKESNILEFIGEIGSGKSNICYEVINIVEQKKVDYENVLPLIYDFSQLRDITCRISKLDYEKYEEIFKSIKNLNLSNRYDFFYFLTQHLIKHNLLIKNKMIIIDDIDLIDSYTKDFIQYLIEAAPNQSLRFISFSVKPIFTFSTKIRLPLLSKVDLIDIIGNLVDDTTTQVKKASELLLNISSKNLYVIKTLLTNLLQDRYLVFDNLSQYIDEKNSCLSLYSKGINALDELSSDILVSIFLLEEYANKTSLEFIYPNSDLSTQLDFLVKHHFLASENENYFIKNPITFKDFFEELDKKKQHENLNKLIKLKKEIGINDLKLTAILMSLNDYNAEIFETTVNYLKKINSNKKLAEVINFIILNDKEEKKQFSLLVDLGKINKKLNQLESAAENFRQALKLSKKLNIDSDEIVYLLSESLFAINSSTFALEIIKKYSQTTSYYWLCKLLLLKANIFMDIEKFDDALDVIHQAHEYYEKLDNDISLNTNILGEYHKTLGKLYYYNNQWDKAEDEFVEAERAFKKINDLEGQAACYNNLGVIAMFKGKWEETETLYLRSIDLEKKRFSLNGLSICYSNLGSLLEDEGNKTKSLFYLNKALDIQKLLNDRYNITNIYNNIGITYMNMGDIENAKRVLKLSLKTAMNFNLFRNIIASYNNLGALHFKIGDWSRAIEYYEQAIEKSNDSHFWEGLCQSYNNLGEVYEKREEYNLARELYYKGIELLPQITDEYLKAELYGNMGSILTKMHNFGEAYRYLVESFDFFKTLDIKEKILEGCLNHSVYFLNTNNYESSLYYLNTAKKIANELNSPYNQGRVFYVNALLEMNKPDKALELIKQSIDCFSKTDRQYNLARANFLLANILLEKNNWEQALQLLKETHKTVKKFNSINFLEKIDKKIQYIHKAFEQEMKSSELQDSLLSKFYEITQQLNEITDFDVLLQTSLDNLIFLTEASGGLFNVYPNDAEGKTWEYHIRSGELLKEDEKDIFTDLMKETYIKKASQNYMQPQFCPNFNNIITLNLSIRNKSQGVILLYSKQGSHYFTERMQNLISAICNQIIVIIENIRYSNLEKSHALIRESLNQPTTYTNIIGKSEKIQQIYDLIDKIKDTPTTILLEGPSGTGKELIAKAIHYNSNRKNKPLIAQYCGALPETLLESELFGHVKGAFTGAAYDKKGLFEIADGGTFFLDEIGDVSMSTQAKLLRFLQEGEVKRVGSTTTNTVDVRMICATNVDLLDKVNKGEFRSDLYYRLNVIKIDMPSLKERKSDIPLLAIHFLDKYNKRINKKLKGITDEAMKFMMECDWPGNIRQLENEIERAVTLVDNDSFIKASDLSSEIFKYSQQHQTIELLEKISLKDAVENLEKNMILQALEKSNGNQTQAAKELGLSRQGLIKKIKRFELARD